MKKNVGSTDQIIRVIIAFVIFVIGYINHSWWGILGLFPLLTALIGFCPLYAILGISTRKAK